MVKRRRQSFLVWAESSLPWSQHFLWKYSTTCNFCCFYPIVMKFGTQDQYNMALWKIEFSELLRQALPWQPHISGKIISFSFSFCSFYPIGMKFGTQDRYNIALWKIEFSELLRQALPWQPHISGKIISFSFSFCSFYPISDHLQIWHEGALW